MARSFGGIPFMLRRSSRRCFPASTLISAKGLVVPHVVEGLLRRKHQVQAPGQLLERRYELEAQVFIVEDVEERIVVVQIVEAVLVQEIHDRLETCFKLAQLVLGVEDVEDRVVVIQIIEAVRVQEIHDRFETCFKLAQFVLGEAERIENFFLLPLVVGVDRLLDVVADADVVDHEALVLELSGDAIDPRNSLQDVVGDDHLVEIHHLLDRRVEAREQHVL